MTDNITHKAGKNSSAANIEEVASRALNEHGYLFQQKCLLDIREKAKQWYIEAEEYPVGTSLNGTVIDFILRLYKPLNYFFVFECKRVHPNYATWVFAETASRRSNSIFLATTTQRDRSPGPPAKIGFKDVPLIGPKNHKKGVFASTAIEASFHPKPNKRTSQTETIRDACKQTMVGIAGIITDKITRADEVGTWYYLPIVVTTAKLFIAHYNPAKVATETGTLPADKLKAKEVDWLFYDFPLFSEIYDNWIPESFTGHDPAQLSPHKKRQVIIVTANKLIEFLNQVHYALEY